MSFSIVSDKNKISRYLINSQDKEFKLPINLSSMVLIQTLQNTYPFLVSHYCVKEYEHQFWKTFMEKYKKNKQYKMLYQYLFDDKMEEASSLFDFAPFLIGINFKWINEIMIIWIKKVIPDRLEADSKCMFIQGEKYMTMKFCHGCKKNLPSSDIFRCSRNQLNYCSQDCQIKDWKNHQSSCSVQVTKIESSDPIDSEVTLTNMSIPLDDKRSSNQGKEIQHSINEADSVIKRLKSKISDLTDKVNNGGYLNQNDQQEIEQLLMDSNGKIKKYL